jgi:hypothetical protein
MKNSIKRNPKDKIEAIVDALLESDQMESTARYLTSGRRFAGLETEEIKKMTMPAGSQKRRHPGRCRPTTLGLSGLFVVDTTNKPPTLPTSGSTRHRSDSHDGEQA